MLFLRFNACSVTWKHCFSRFIIAAQRGNNIFAILSSPRGAETIFLPFYRRRAARKQYFCHFIVVARRGNNIFAVLSSPLGAGTIFLHFSACSVTASIKIFCFHLCRMAARVGMVGAVPVCPPERPRSGVSIPKTVLRDLVWINMPYPALSGTKFVSL